MITKIKALFTKYYPVALKYAVTAVSTWAVTFGYKTDWHF